MNASLKRSLSSRYGVAGTLAECCDYASRLTPSPLSDRLAFLAHQLSLRSGDPLRLEDAALKKAAADILSELPEPTSSRFAFAIRLFFRFVCLALMIVCVLFSLQSWGYAVYIPFVAVVLLRWRYYPRPPAALLSILFALFLAGLYVGGALAPEFLHFAVLAVVFFQPAMAL